MSENLETQFVEYVIKTIVNEPEKVSVHRTVDDMGILLAIQVAPLDMGLLIGKEGSTVKALRVLCRALGQRARMKVSIRILEPESNH